jgi:hypothetical protein
MCTYLYMGTHDYTDICVCGFSFAGVGHRRRLGRVGFVKWQAKTQDINLR